MEGARLSLPIPIKRKLTRIMPGIFAQLCDTNTGNETEACPTDEEKQEQTTNSAGKKEKMTAASVD